MLEGQSAASDSCTCSAAVSSDFLTRSCNSPNPLGDADLLVGVLGVPYGHCSGYPKYSLRESSVPIDRTLEPCATRFFNTYDAFCRVSMSVHGLRNGWPHVSSESASSLCCHLDLHPDKVQKSGLVIAGEDSSSFPTALHLAQTLTSCILNPKLGHPVGGHSPWNRIILLCINNTNSINHMFLACFPVYQSIAQAVFHTI